MKGPARARKILLGFLMLLLPFLFAFRTNIGFWQGSCPIPGGKVIYNDGHDYVEAACNTAASPPTLMYKYYPLKLMNTCGDGIASKGYAYNCNGPGAVWDGGGCSTGYLMCNNVTAYYTRYPNSAPPQDFVFGTAATEGTYYTNSGNDNDYGDTCVSYDGKRTLVLYRCGDQPNYGTSCPMGYTLNTVFKSYRGHPSYSVSCTASPVLEASATSTSAPTYVGPESCRLSRRSRVCSCPSGQFSYLNKCYQCPSGTSWSGSSCVSCPSGTFPLSSGCYACPSGGSYNGTTCVAPVQYGSITVSW